MRMEDAGCGERRQDRYATLPPASPILYPSHMGYRTLRECVEDPERHRHLVRIEAEVDARLEAAEIHRRVCAAGGPALLFTRVKGCRFPMVSNLFGTMDRARFMFRDSLERVRRLVELRVEGGSAAWRRPLRYATAARTALTMLPRFVGRGDVTANETTISHLPQLVCWPEDGGAFITLPQVYTEDVDRPGWRRQYPTHRPEGTTRPPRARR